MTPSELLNLLSSEGINVWVEGEDLRYSGPKGALTEPLRLALRANKPLLLATLKSELTPIPPAPTEGSVPLSFAQERLWFLDQMTPESAAYNVPLAWRLRGELDIEVLRRTFEQLVQRHDVLRTRFEVRHGQPEQIIRPAPAWALFVHDLSTLSASEREAEVRRRVELEAYTPFPLQADSLLRTSLLRTGVSEHVLLITLHHIVTDAWSIEILMREMTALYEAFRLAKPSSLSAPTLRYADFTVWQRSQLQGEALEREVAYWKESLAGAAVLALPTDRRRPRVQRHRGAVQAFELSPDTTRRLRSLGGSHGATLFMTLMGIFQVLLHRYTGQEDFSVGTPIANRTRRELDDVVGCFVNTVVLRSQFDGSATFVQVLAKVKAATLGAFAHQELAFSRVVEALGTRRDTSRNPLFQVMLTLDPASSVAAQLAGLTVETIETAQRNARCDLSAAFVERGAGLSGCFEYDVELFEVATIQRLVTHLERLIAAVLDQPERPVSELRLLSAAEEHRLLVEWNGREVEVQGPAFAHQRFEALAAQCPDAVAVAQGASRLTYQALNREANRLAQHLRQLGVKADTRVAICLQRAPALAVAVLAVLKAGGAYVPLDPSYPLERLAFTLCDCAPLVALTDTQGAEVVRAALSRQPSSSQPVVVLDLQRDVACWADQPDTNPEPEGVGLTSEHLAYVIYTSGSTGKPKGVMALHRGLTNYLAWACHFYEPVEGALVASSFSFDATITSLLAPLVCGGATHLIPEGQELDGLRDEVLDVAARRLLKLTPAHLSALGQMVAESGGVSSVGVAVVGGEALPPSVVEEWRRIQPGVRLVNEYGPTETVVGCVVYDVPETFSASSATVPIGKPIWNTRIYLLDTHQRPVPVGVVGEIFIGGAGVARGYLNRPDLTAERFVPDPFAPRAGSRMYQTGDLGRYLPDGNIEFLGRRDSQVKVRGYRIELGEVEARLKTYPGVRDAVVVARQDGEGERGETEARLIAYFVVAAGGGQVDVDRLRAHAEDELPAYMVPAAFVMIDALPLTRNGKVDHDALPAPVSNDFAVVEYEAPVGDVEVSLAALWQEVLSVEQVGRHDNFFELGGHSIVAMVVVSRLRLLLGVELPVGAMFELPTVAELAAHIEGKRCSSRGDARSERAGAADADAIPVLRPRPERVPLSFAQNRLWFLDQLEAGNAAYNIPIAQRLEGDLDVAALRSAFQEIVRRHEVLRTTFVSVAGEPTQMIHECCAWILPVEDLSGIPETERESELLRRALAEAERPFSLQDGPLLRTSLLRLSARSHVLLITLHHIVADGWSTEILSKELGASYAAFRTGQPPRLEPLPVQYADFAVWQQAFLQSPLFEQQQRYWRSALLNAATLQLRTDYQRPAVKTYRGASYDFMLPADVSAQVRALGQQHDATLFMTLLAVFQVLLHRYTGQADISVGTPIASRTRHELEPLIGCFLNTLVMRTDLSGEPDFLTVLSRVKEAALGAYAHQDMPFERLVAELGVARDQSRSPLFQVMLTVQGEESIAPLQMPGLSASRVVAEQRLTKFDLTLSFVDRAGALSGWIEYNTDLFERSTIARLSEHLQELMRGIVKAPHTPVSGLQLSTPRERHQLLVEWNATELEFPREACVHELFETQVELTPDALAVVFENHGLTYRELDRRANQLAHHLRGLGVGAETLVGVCLERSLELVVALLGIMKAGGAYLPLDPEYPAARLELMLADAEVRVVCTQESLKTLVSGHEASTVLLDRDWPVIARKSASSPGKVSRADNLLYAIYTSGSTGKPKAALNEQRGVVNRLTWMQREYGLSEADRVLQKTPCGFDVSGWELFCPLLSGARLVMARPGGHRDARYLAETVASSGITVLHFVPSMLEAFLAQADVGRWCSSLRYVICSGEALSADLVRRFHEQLGAVELHNLYGPTEAAIEVSRYACVPGATRVPVPIGKPIANVQLYIVDSSLRPTPVGVAGELLIGGVGVGRGYLNRPELTAEKFIADCFSERAGSRLYRTGDLARYLEDGNIEFLGRMDEQIKLRGFRVELGEVEQALREQAGVREAVVAAREDTPGDKRLVAYVVPTEPVDDELKVNLRAQLKLTLPDYMVPSAFVLLEALPLTPNGKLDRQALPLPDGASHGARSYEAPLGEIEAKLSELWSQLLGVERVGRHDNFFELGGHSLLAMRLIERMRGEGMVLEVRALFATPTIAAVAPQLGTGARALEVHPNRIPVGCERITPAMLPLVELSQEQIDSVVAAIPGGAANVKDIYPLAPLQEGILFHHRMAHQGDGYLMSNLYALKTRASLDRTLEALGRVVQRHDALRTAVIWDGLPEPVQVVQRVASLPVSELSLPSDVDAATELRARFDPRRFRLAVQEAPLLHAYVAYDASRERWLMLLLLHHLVVDHAAVELLWQEVEAFVHGTADSLRDPVPYQFFVAQARLGRVWEQGEAFFKGMLEDVIEPTLPFGLDDVYDSASAIQESYLELEGSLSQRLRQQARRLGVSPASIFHAAWARVLGSASDRRDVVFGTVLLGRTQASDATGPVMGLFMNTLPLRVLLGERSVETCVLALHASLGELLQHDQVPLALAQRCSGVSAPQPLFSALLNYRHFDQPAPDAVAASVVEAPEILFADERTNYPLTLSVDDSGRAFGLKVQVQGRVEPHYVAHLVHTALQRLIEALEAQNATCMRDIDALSEAERRRLLVEWNASTREPVPDLCIHQLFEAQARRTPDAVAVVFDESRLTYAELDRRANCLAALLQRHGVGSETLVGVCLERSPNLLIALLAVLKAGAGYVPLDPNYPEQRLTFMLQDAGVRVVCTQASLTARLVTGDMVAVLVDVEEQSPASAATPSAVSPRPEQLAYVMYTSGSTGVPKGVAIEHRSAAAFINWAARTFSAQDLRGVLAATSICFDLSIFELFVPLAVGGTLHLAHSVMDLPRVGAGGEITLVNTVPSAMAELLASDGIPRSVRVVNLAGEPLADALVQALYALDHVAQVFDLYGPTEATTYSTFALRRRGSGSPTTIGRPIDGTQVYILDEDRAPVPRGAIGELYLGGRGLARGYLGRPELTRERFVDNPFENGTRLYRTGDRARYLADGNIEFVGRADSQVKLRGFRIELGEIERKLKDHPSIRDAVAVLRDDASSGKYLVACVVVKTDASPSRDELVQHLRVALPDYMVPSAFVFLDALPLTPSGKVDRNALPTHGTRDAGLVLVMPRTAQETAVTEIWRDVLGLEQVGVHENFFQMGGHSLSATRVLSRLRLATGLDLSLRTLFEHPTIAELAAVIERLTAEGDRQPSRPAITSAARVRKDLRAEKDVGSPGIAQ